jgi:hypothetical protein
MQRQIGKENPMKSLLTAGVASIVLASTLSLDRAMGAGSQEAADGTPWVVGRCYRVFPSEPDRFQTFKVLEPATGIWVRVQPSPSSPMVPGARPQAPLWINTSTPFAVQEWTCGI